MIWVGAAIAGTAGMFAVIAVLSAWGAQASAARVLLEHVHDAHASFAPCLEIHPQHGPCIRPREHLDPMHFNSDGWTWN